jgi:hypothetical protein
MTSWKERHAESLRLADEARAAFIAGETEQCRRLYADAASAEAEALGLLDESKARTYGITAVSAASLFFKADAFVDAEALSHRALLRNNLPPFATEQLRQILLSVWHQRERASSRLKFFPGEVTVAVRGGQILTGGAPLDLIVEKVQTIQALFYRIVEMISGLAHRNRGAPPRDIMDLCKPWLFQAVPGSYQFAVAVESPKQEDLFWKKPEGIDIARKFVEVLAAANESPEVRLAEIVPAADYRKTILKLTRNLTPTGKAFDEIEIRSASGERSVRLELGSRKVLQESLKRLESPDKKKGEPVELRGTLRNVHLDKNWIELATEEGLQHVEKISDAVDDLIGPMVNRPVLVRALKKPSGKLHFVDIEPTD